ncbi:MAG: sigma-70 family RNA polymerase sigma factor [Planctomycetales bacterium]|nr:sigma-70 family RNA polymerase sigma factor [Planctomycetales bacterium]
MSLAATPNLSVVSLRAKEEAAFAELVRRHSGLVMSVCRRVLRDGHDIDDVFQATFLVFVRDAVRVKKQASLASWLYGVAHRLAVRVAQQRQQRRETGLVDDTAVGDDVLTDLADRYDQQLVDAELNALPERCRQPLVLKYLAGKTPLEVASELKLTVGAVEGLLKRGKQELRARLMKRGVKLGAAVIAVQMTRQAVQAACPKQLMEETIRTGLAWNSTNPPPLDLISDRVLELTLKELATMTTLTKTGLTTDWPRAHWPSVWAEPDSSRANFQSEPAPGSSRWPPWRVPPQTA